MRRSRTTALSALLVSATLALTGLSVPAAASAAASAVQAAQAAPAKAGKNAKAVTLTASHSERTAGQRTVLRGTARTERGVKREVGVEIKLLGKWEDLTTVPTSRTGAFKVAFKAPNPGSSIRFRFRAVVKPVKSTKVRKAWRGAARSPMVRVRFRNDPARPQPSYSLPDPASCDSGTPGVMAQTAACVAAVEVQMVERLWLDMRLVALRDKSLDALMELAVQYVSADGAHDEFALVFPYTSAYFLESELPADDEDREMMMGALAMIASGFHSALLAFEPSAARATAWKPAWNEHFIVKDLAQITIAGTTATTPERSIKADKSTTLTMGGEFTYVDGRWYVAGSSEPTALR